MLTRRILSTYVYDVAFWAAKHQMFLFSGLRHFLMSQIGGVWRKLNTVHNSRPLPTNVIKTVSVLEQLHGDIVRRNSVVQKGDGQTDIYRETNRQKRSTFWPPRRRVKSEPYQTWHGDRGPRARSCTSENLVVGRIVPPLGGTENVGKPVPLILKTP